MLMLLIARRNHSSLSVLLYDRRDFIQPRTDRRVGAGVLTKSKDICFDCIFARGSVSWHDRAIEFL